jgi:hypothetical protein
VLPEPVRQQSPPASPTGGPPVSPSCREQSRVRLICPLQAMAGAGKIATEEGYALVAFPSAGAFLVLRGR